MYRLNMTAIVMIVVFYLSLLPIIQTEDRSTCKMLKDVIDEESDSLIKLRSRRAVDDVVRLSRETSNLENLDSIPDFDLNQIDSENDINQILKRFRRGRSSSGGGGGGRFSSSSSRSSSSSSSGGSRFFGGSRSSSSSSSGGTSRIFSRSGSSSSSSSSSGGTRIFSRGGTSSDRTSRVRSSLDSLRRKISSSSGSGGSSGSSGFPGTSGSKPGFSDKIRKITHGTGGGVSGFGTGGSSGSGGNVWVRAGKKFLPQAVRFGKRYYQRRKYNKGMYAGIGAGTGYYAGSRMDHHGQYNPHDNYGYPPVVDNRPETINGQTPTVFYCIQEDLNITLVNKTLNAEGFGTCNISGKLVTCPIEIECKTAEADTCCEDEQRTPYCCGGPIPDEYQSPYGGYEDDWNDGTDSIHQLLNLITVVSIMLTTICLTIWQRRT